MISRRTRDGVTSSWSKAVPEAVRRLPAVTLPGPRSRRMESTRTFIAACRLSTGPDSTASESPVVSCAVRRGRAILLGIRNDNEPYQYLRPRPGGRWNFDEFDISGFKRDKVTAVMYYWLATQGYHRPDDPCVYDIDSLCLWHQEPKPQPPRELPAHIADYKSSIPDDAPSRLDSVVPIEEWFPMGVYDGICGRSNQECEWLFDEMRRLHMNTVYISNGTLNGLERILPLARSTWHTIGFPGAAAMAACTTCILPRRRHGSNRCRMSSCRRRASGYQSCAADLGCWRGV